MFSIKQTRKSIELIDRFLNTVDQGGIIFREGVRNYLQGNKAHFQDNLLTLSSLETDADQLKRQIENILYTQSLMPQLRGDILKLLESLDTIIDNAKSNLFQFDVETPFIPPEIHADLIRLTEMSTAAVVSVILASTGYFRNPESVKENLHKVYLYEQDADKLADAIKRKVFQEMPNLKLSEKFHLRYFTLHIENISDVAQNVADLLAIMLIKRTI